VVGIMLRWRRSWWWPARRARHPRGVLEQEAGRAGAERAVHAEKLRLEQLYRVRFTYSEGWMVSLEGGWQQHLFLADGHCEVRSVADSAASTILNAELLRARSDLISAPSSSPMTGPRSWSSCTVMVARTRLADDRSSAPYFT
jgi:hypothetical protein